MKFADLERPYIIAEIGSNHNGDMALARDLIRSAKESGCDCAKFQSWDTGLWADEVYEKDEFLSDGREMTESLRTLAERYAVSRKDLEELRDCCREIGIDFASSAFNPQQASDLVELGASIIKIASMDVTNDHMLTAAGNTGLPVVLSTGLSSLEEIAHAVETIERTDNLEIALLHCVALYPPPDTVVNLRNIGLLRKTFGYPTGFSDHTKGVEISLAAISLGACIVEKHFTLDQTMPGWDHAISANPAEMGVICSGAERISAALGTSRRVVSAAEKDQRMAFRRSIVLTRDVAAGEVIETGDLDFRRPATGIEPNLMQLVVGQMAARDITGGTILQFDDLTPHLQE